MTTPEPPAPARHIWSCLLPAVICAALLVVLCALFIPRQCIWVDESTQLAGLSLPPMEQARWLVGHDADRFGVPPDRTPPLSYWTGRLWSSAFGLTEPSMRWFGVVLSVGACIFVVGAGRRLAGVWGAVAAGLLFALSPNIISTAVEIRAYPLFLLTASFTLYSMIRSIEADAKEATRWLVLMSVGCLLSVYTHFFGVVLAAACFGACLAVALLARKPIRPLVIAGVAVGVLSLGLVPFITSSAAMSAPEVGAGSRVRDVARLIFRLVGHPAVAVSKPAIGLAALGSIGLALLAIAFGKTGPRRSLIIAIALGLAATMAAGMVIKSFDALKPTYSTWLLPAIAMLFASATSIAAKPLRYIARGSVVAVACAQLYGAAMLARHGEAFAHGPHRMLEQMIQGHRDGLTVVHEAGTAWGATYFPLRYEFGPDLPQYLGTSADSGEVAKLPANKDKSPGLAIPHDRVLVIASTAMRTPEIAQFLHGSTPTIAAGPVSKALKASPDWRLVQSRTSISFVGATAELFERVKPSR